MLFCNFTLIKYGFSVPVTHLLCAIRPQVNSKSVLSVMWVLQYLTPVLGCSIRGSTVPGCMRVRQARLCPAVLPFYRTIPGQKLGEIFQAWLGPEGGEVTTPIVAMPPASEHCCSRSSMLVGTLPQGWDQPLIISETAFIVEAEGPRCTPGGGTGRDMAGEGPIKWSGRCVLYSLAF